MCRPGSESQILETISAHKHNAVMYLKGVIKQDTRANAGLARQANGMWLRATTSLRRGCEFLALNGSLRQLMTVLQRQAADEPITICH